MKLNVFTVFFVVAMVFLSTSCVYDDAAVDPDSDPIDVPTEEQEFISSLEETATIANGSTAQCDLLSGNLFRGEAVCYNSFYDEDGNTCRTTSFWEWDWFGEPQMTLSFTGCDDGDMMY